MTLNKKTYNIEILTPASQHCLTLLYNLTIVIRHCNIDIATIDLTLCELHARPIQTCLYLAILMGFTFLDSELLNENNVIMVRLET